MKKKQSGRFWAVVKRMARDVRGVAAVEFAYIAPVMMIMFLGTLEVSRAVSLDRRFGLATSMVADLVAREETMTAADLNAIYDIVAHIMSPYDSSSLQIAVIPVMANPNNRNDTKVYAASTNRPTYQGAVQPAQGSDYSLTTDLLSAGTSVIVVEASYEYTPMLTGEVADFKIGSADWTDRAILTPRNSCVDFDDNGCVVSGLFSD